MRHSIGLLSLLLGSLALARPDPAAFSSRRQSEGGKYKPKTPPLTTPWTDKVGTNPWPEHPRPQLERTGWRNLNGIWKYKNAKSGDDIKDPPAPDTLSQEVLIPSCVESGLSGESQAIDLDLDVDLV